MRIRWTKCIYLQSLFDQFSPFAFLLLWLPGGDRSSFKAITFNYTAIYYDEEEGVASAFFRKYKNASCWSVHAHLIIQFIRPVVVEQVLFVDIIFNLIIIMIIL